MDCADADSYERATDAAGCYSDAAKHGSVDGGDSRARSDCDAGAGDADSRAVYRGVTPNSDAMPRASDDATSGYDAGDADVG